MLPASARLRHRRDFAETVRNGRRAARGALVAHLVAPTDGSDTDTPPRIGLVVSRHIGPAVARTRVRRRLRHLMRDRLAALPPGGRLVIRALPPAADRTSAALGRDLDALLATLPAGPRR